MMNNSGYSKLYRDYLDSDLWLAEPFTKGQAWVDLFSLANHKQQTIWIRGIEVVVRRGELARSELSLARRWQWSREKVRRFLKWLEGDGKIRQQKNKVTSLIYIINYDRYNSNETTEQTTNETTEKHQTRQQKDIKPDNKRDTDKHDKHDKHEKNIPPNPQDLTEYLKKQAGGLGLGAFVESLVGFLNYRKEMGEQIKQKGGIDFILKQALEIKNAGFDVDYFINEAMQKGDNWFSLEKHNGKNTKKTKEVGNYVDPIHFLPPAEKERILQEKFKALMQ